MIDTELLNFTVGPVQSSDEVREIGSHQVPYFRTPDFSELMLENETLVKKFAKADDNARVCFMTASGTGAMEATVANCFTDKDNLLIVNGGSFGHRFVELAQIYEIPHTVIELSMGEPLTKEHLSKYEGLPFTGFLINVHETSTGVHYDIEMISEFCKRNNLFLIVDAISSFLCDEFDMKRLDAKVMITGAQKALACPPGISIIVLSPEAIKRVKSNRPKCMYLDLKLALTNGERGQTPFTPAVQTLIQINTRLKQIDKNGGVDFEIKRCKALAEDFRTKIQGLPLKMYASSPSNAVTSLTPLNVKAYDVFLNLMNKYHIWICPNGGELKDTVFRVGHLGYLSPEDNTMLVNALKDMYGKGLL